jgi:CRP/FNR family transcriptional regulator, cyclic AMP receptor protein
MVDRLAARFVLIALVVVFGSGAAVSFAADDAKKLSLSRALGQAKLFAGLTDREKTALKSAATLRLCREGERIIEQAKPLDRMFILLDGEAEVRVNGKAVATLPGQSLIGEIEFLDMLPASADVVVLEETHLIELNSASLTNLMKKRPRLGYELMSRIATIEGQRLRAMDNK